MGEGEAESDPAGVGATRFSATLWSVVLLAGQHPSPQSEQALATLCRAYWYPLYAFIRRNGHDLADAQDLTQAFFVHLLDHHRLGQVRREKGKFRSFLLASLRNFLADQRDKAQAQKRGGQASVISLDTAEDSYRLEPVHTLSPEKLFERRWALTVLQRVLDRLEGEYASRGMQERFAALQPFLLGEDGTDTYAHVGERLGMSEGAVKMAVLRLRQRGREFFREEIAATVATDEEIEDEVRSLTTVLAG